MLGAMLKDLEKAGKIERRILSRMHAIRDMANLGPHGDDVQPNDAARVLDDLCEILNWYLEHYGESVRDPSRRVPVWVIAIAIGFVAHLLVGIIIYVCTDHGNVKIELSDPKANVQVRVDGVTIDITGMEQPLRLKLGDRKLMVTGKDFDIVAPELFTVKRWGNPVVQVTLIPKQGANTSVAVQPMPKEQSPHAAIKNSIGMELVLIPPGKFLMGTPDNDDQAGDNEKPRHEVEITKAFYLGKYEVTRGQFRKFVDEAGYQTEAEKDGQGGNGYDAATNGKFKRDTTYSWRNAGIEQTDEHPGVNVTWNDAVAFCDWLARKEGKKCRLPTEAEWEYSCRARTETRYYSGNDSETLASVGNVADASFKRKFFQFTWPMITNDDGYVFTAPVGRFKPNGLGLHDMHGNVAEWCQDWFDAAYYQNSPKQDPQGPSAGSFRVVRGGSFKMRSPSYSRAAFRIRNVPAFRLDDLGFRVVLVP